ncbi:MAG TPA: hypothetical protein VJ723_01450, partial [Candidatus Angelobacter sp.]|nr:hypothetical protein [Candidatus Angelobacter sp.]
MTMKLLARLLLELSVVVSAYSSQSAAGQKGAGSGAAGTPDQAAPAGLGFSIESEMMTYKSVQANSEAIACDIARYLYGPEVGSASANGPCIIQSRPNVSFGVVIVSPSSTIFSDVQAWRVDMATMHVLEQRANKFCATEPQSRQRGAAAGAATKAASAAFDFTIPGQMLPLAESALGLFASNTSISPVVGTVHDRALMNAVARQLKTLRVSVLIPEIYNPYALGAADFSKSPFFTNLADLVEARASCEQAKKDPQQEHGDVINSIIAGIDAFLATTLGTAPPPASPGDPNAKADAAPKPKPAVPPSAEVASHLNRVLAADSLARAMGVDSTGTDGTSSPWQYVLSLESLESGGTVLRRGNIFGTKVRYSGGAVATFALFALDGNLDCSGNVYDFEGDVRPEDFRRSFRKPLSDPTEQLAFVRGGCAQTK